MRERLRGGKRSQEVLGGDLRDEGDGALGDRGRALGVQDGEADGVEEGEREEKAGEGAEEDPERDAAEARGGAGLRPGNRGPRRRGRRRRGLRRHGLRVERLGGGGRAQREEREQQEEKGGGQERQGFGRVPARHPSSYLHETSIHDLQGETSKIPWSGRGEWINAQDEPIVACSLPTSLAHPAAFLHGHQRKTTGDKVERMQEARKLRSSKNSRMVLVLFTHINFATRKTNRKGSRPRRERRGAWKEEEYLTTKNPDRDKSEGRSTPA